MNLLREFSVPLIFGVALAMIWANRDPLSYYAFLHSAFIGSLSFHFLTNDIFMVFFFGIAAAELTRSFLPGGALNPVKKAINPILSTCGGVVGPAVVYLALNALMGSQSLQRGWGIPTATDIAFAWLVARMVFGANHPAVSFLLLLAVADDGIGLAIIAFFYPNPKLPVHPVWLVLTLGGMTVAYLLRAYRMRSYWPYLLAGAGLSWVGLYRANLHPALALVFIIPFLPHAREEHKRFFEVDMTDRSASAQFEHDWRSLSTSGCSCLGLPTLGWNFRA